MRIFSILTAALVMGVLYLMIFERESILNFAAGGPPAGDAPMAADVETSAETTPTSQAPVPDDAPPLVSVVAMASQATDIDSAVMVRGRTEAARQVELRAETSGQVISEPLRKGSSVQAGQVLCRLDPGTRGAALADAQSRLAEAGARVPQAQARIPEALARVAEAEARLAEADINLRAASRLSEGGFASETRVAAAQAARESALATISTAQSGVATADLGVLNANAGIKSAEAAVAAAEKEIERLTLTAPFSGLLESDTAEIGSLMQPGSLCATIIQLDPIKLVGFVPETSVSKVAVGALAGARLTSGMDVVGQVTFLSRSADPATRTFRVEIQVPNADLRISDGQTAEIGIASEGQPAHLLPMSALTLDDNGQLGVRTVNDANRVQFARVNIVRDTAEGIWVTGLENQADVIVIGQEYVVSGVPVNVTYQGADQ